MVEARQPERDPAAGGRARQQPSGVGGEGETLSWSLGAPSDEVLEWPLDDQGYETDHSEPAGEAEVAMTAVSHAAHLRRARGRGRAALAALRSNPDPQDWGAYLLPAGRQLLDALGGFLHDRVLWERLAAAEDRVDTVTEASALWISEILDQDIEGLLDYLGYAPPPDASEWAVEIKDAVADVLAARVVDDHSSGTRTARANLTIFQMRLRSCIEYVEERSLTSAERASGGRRLASVVRRGVLVAGPAVLAASAVALLPGAGAAAASVGEALGGALAAGGSELVGTAVAAGSASLLSRMLRDEPSTASQQQRLTGALQRTRDSLGDLARELASGLPSRRTRPVLVETIAAVHDLLKVSTLMRQPLGSHLRGLGEEVLRQLQPMTDAYAEGAVPDEMALAAVADAVRYLEGPLRELIEAG